MMRSNLTELWNDWLAHRCRLEEEKKILKYALYDGDLKKANQVKRDIAWRESEIRRLRSLIDNLLAESESKAV